MNSNNYSIIFLVTLLCFSLKVESQNCIIYNEDWNLRNPENIELLSHLSGLPIDMVKHRNSCKILDYDVLYTAYDADHYQEEEFDCQIFSKLMEKGGLLFTDYYGSEIAPYYPVSGLNYHTKLIFNKAELGLSLRWMNDSLELEIPFCKDGKEGIKALEFDPSRGLDRIIAYYEDSTIAIASRKYGDGELFYFGMPWRKLTYFPRNNRDLSAQRTYSNGFEPGADIISLLIRGIIEEHFPVTVWKHTLPKDYKSALVITHDVDKADAYANAQSFIDYERSNNIPAHYFIGTKYMSDSTSGPLYNDYKGKALLRTLLDGGFTVGSNGVGGFNDFDDKEVFPLGTTDVSKETYSPLYNNIATTGGTVLGEALVSKHILEADGAPVISTFRSGRLKFNKYQPEGLQTAGYTAESSFRANDVMTGFPYFLQKGQSSTEPLVDVLEIPVHISDAVDYLNADEYTRAVDIWEDIIGKYSDNYAPVTLAIDPDEDYKLAALDELLQRLEGKTELINFEELNTFWRERHNLTYYTDLDSTNKILTITIPEDVLPISSNQSLHITKGKSLDTIIVVSDQGMPINHRLQDWDETSYLLRFESGINDFQIEEKTTTCDELLLKLSLADTSQTADSILWNFGDGTSTMQYDLSSVMHSYTVAQTCKLNLRIYSNGVVTDITKRYDIILTEVPQADFIWLASDSNKQVPVDLHLYNRTKTTENDSLSFLWTISRGDTIVESQQEDFDYQFTTPGIYTLHLEVQNRQGCSSAYQQEIEVLPHTIATDSFNVDLRPEGELPAEAEFEVEAQPGVDFDSLLWHFGDSESLMVYDSNVASHLYDSAGTFDVSLTLWNYGEHKTITKKEALYIPTKAQAGFDIVVSDSSYTTPLPLTGTNTSLVDHRDSVSYQWTISGMGQVATYNQKTLEHTFDQAGEYSIKLELYTAFGYSSHYTKEVKINEQASSIKTLTAGLIKIGPNPTRDKVVITIEKQTKDVEVAFFDLQGQQLSYSKSISQPLEVPIDKGLCIVKITIDGKSYLTKVMKW